MHARIRSSLSAVLLVAALLAITGCARHPAQTAQALNGNNQAAQQASTDPNQGTTDNPPSDSAPTLANSNAGNGGGAQPSGAPVANNAPAPAPVSKGASYNASNPPAPQQPLIIPAGTPVVVRLQESLSSASSASGQRFEAVLDKPLYADNQLIAPVGTTVIGHVTLARKSGRLRHPGELGLTLDSVVLGQSRVPILTSSVVVRGGSHKKRNLGWIGGGTGGGALIGALAGGGKAALIGGGIGAAAGTTTALLTGKKDVGFGVERRLTFRLHRDVPLQS
jgi:hypothetical protein